MSNNQKLIPVFFPFYDRNEEKAVIEVLRSGWIGLGPKTAEFENKFAAYAGAKYAIALNSATAALHLSLMAAGVGSGDEVILPAMTFASTAHAVLYVGAKPVFADIEKNTMCVDP
ncbi:MAG: Spore coat polysaccharide biosynthesis protein SpsC, partial [Candidatus Woesebacteria bacterium GW2011_GWD1_38_10]